MSWRRIAALCSVLLVLGVVCAAPAMASWLDSVTPYNDGTMTWKGDTPFSSPDDPLLFGDVEWAVFAPSQTLPFSGYARPAGQFTYVYQFCNGTDAAAISYYGVVLQNTAQAIEWTNDGLFGPSLVEPDSASIASDGSTANWYFSNLAGSTHSSGLVYSSPNPPTDFFGIVINNGDVAIDEPIPSPTPGAIPEPATIWLLLGGLVRCWQRAGGGDDGWRRIDRGINDLLLGAGGPLWRGRKAVCLGKGVATIALPGAST